MLRNDSRLQLLKVYSIKGLSLLKHIIIRYDTAWYGQINICTYHTYTRDKHTKSMYLYEA